MAAALPTESAADKAVQTFGLGPYDEAQSEFDHGEDSNERSHKKTLPDAGGPLDPMGPDRLLGYPQTFSTAELPGDFDRPSSGWLRSRDVVVNRVPTVSQSELPSGGPVPRADYYDRMTISYNGNEWPDEDSGSYSSDSLPTPGESDESSDNFLNALGNFWSGYNVQDQSVPAGFPSEEYAENDRFQKTNASELPMKRVATNIDLVRSVTTDFIKDSGKKGLTRRHVMAFLQKSGQHQYLASDVIRCLLLDHGVYVKDVLDEFPVMRSASSEPSSGVSRLASIRGSLIDLEIKHFSSDPETSGAYRAAAAAVTRSIAALERIGGKNG